MKTLLYIHFLLFLQFCFSTNVLAQYPFGEINGTVIDAETGEAIPFVNVRIEGNGELVETVTDFDGSYAIQGLPTGFYSVNIGFVGFNHKQIDEVLIKGNEQTQLNAELGSSCCCLGGYEVIKYREPLLKKDHKTSKTFTRKEIQSMPFRTISDIAGLAGNSSNIR